MHAENTRLFEYFLRILAIKLGDNPIWYRMLCTISRYLSWLVNMQRRCHHSKKIYNCANCLGCLYCDVKHEKKNYNDLCVLFILILSVQIWWLVSIKEDGAKKSNSVSIMKWLQKSTWKEHVWSTFIHRGYSDDVTESEPKGNVT